MLFILPHKPNVISAVMELIIWVSCSPVWSLTSSIRIAWTCARNAHSQARSRILGLYLTQPWSSPQPPGKHVGTWNPQT